MIPSLLISPDLTLNEELAVALAEAPELRILHTFTTYPAVDDVMRSVRVHKPQVVLLFIPSGVGEELTQAETLAAYIDDMAPGLPVIAVGRGFDVARLSELMRVGVRECLAAPFDRDKLTQLADFIRSHLKRHPTAASGRADLYTFLPAKPGVGCSTIAVSTSCALADDLGARTLLMDCDVLAGAVKFRLKLGNSGSILDAIGHAADLDEGLWLKLIGQWEKLEVLHAGELNPPPNIDVSGLERVLGIARNLYEAICADLPSGLDPLSVELMRESRRIFLVTTPEIIPLHLTAVRIRSLMRLGLIDRVSLLLNRKTGKGDFTDTEVAQLAGLPVSYTFSNDYSGVEKSVLEGRPIPHDSSLGDSIMNLARSLTPQTEPKELPKAKGRKFLEFFHVASAEGSTEIWRD